MSDPEKQESRAKSAKKQGILKKLLNWWRDPYRDRAKWTDKTITLLTFGIVFLAFMQWREMHEGGEQTDKIIRADNSIATAMANNVSLAQANYAATVEQAEIAQRAWVSGVIDPPGPIKADQPVTFRFVFTNTGKTPALRVRFLTKRNAVGLTKSPTLDTEQPIFRERDMRAQGQMLPNQESISDITVWFSKKDADLINTQKVRIYLSARIEYDDVFGTHHWTTFCDFYLTSGMFANYSKYNGMDNNRPKITVPKAN